jgi:hypothetical protein
MHRPSLERGGSAALLGEDRVEDHKPAARATFP